MTSSDNTPDPAIVKKMRGTLHFPSPPRDELVGTIGHPAHYTGREYSEDEVEAYAEACADPGWTLVDLRSIVQRNFRGFRATYRRIADTSPPWDADELRDECDLCGGDWQAVAAARGVSYRELRRWLDHPSLASLEPLWREERRRVQLREVEGVSRALGARRDPRALRIALAAERDLAKRGALLAVVRMLELYFAAVADGREPYPGVVEYLRRAGWFG